MAGFNGFPEGQPYNIPIPEVTFRQLIPLIDHIGELKLTMQVFYLLNQVEGSFRFLRREDLLNSEYFINGLAGESIPVDTALDDALSRAIKRGTILVAELEFGGKLEHCYFLNTPRGRAALRAIQSGQWKLAEVDRIRQEAHRPNIFQLYEENIGPLSPLIADALSDAQDRFSDDWIEEAFRIAVEKNKRNWRYVLAILERWQREGKYDRKETSKDRPDTPEARRRYVEGEFSEHVEH